MQPSYRGCILFPNTLLLLQRSVVSQRSNNSIFQPFAGLQARFISALSRKGGISMPISCLKGCKPELNKWLMVVRGTHESCTRHDNQQQTTIHLICMFSLAYLLIVDLMQIQRPPCIEDIRQHERNQERNVHHRLKGKMARRAVLNR